MPGSPIKRPPLQESWRVAPSAPSCVKFMGVVRGSESPSSFVPDNTASEWFWLDVPALAVAAHLPPDTLLVEVLAPEDGLKGGGGEMYPMVRSHASALPVLDRLMSTHATATRRLRAATLSRDAGRPLELRGHMAGALCSHGWDGSECYPPASNSSRQAGNADGADNEGTIVRAVSVMIHDTRAHVTRLLQRDEAR